MPTPPRAICAECLIEMHPEKNGVTLEAFERDRSLYKVDADRWECGGCGRRVYVGFALRVREHFHSDYAEHKADFPFTVR